MKHLSDSDFLIVPTFLSFKMYLDVNTITLGATKFVWILSLPKGVNKAEISGKDPKITEPEGRSFIHCIQHWLVRPSLLAASKTKSRFRKYSKHELDQETLLVDNCGQIYTIYTLCGCPKDMGVKYFKIQPDPAYTPLTIAQIEAIKKVQPTFLPGEEGLPFLEPQIPRWTAEIKAAIETQAIIPATTLETPSKPIALTEPEIVGSKPINPKIEEPEIPERIPLHPRIVWNLQQAYIHMYYSKTEKEDAKLLLSSYLKRILISKAHHVRIDVMSRTQLARKLAKYYDITFPPASQRYMDPYNIPDLLERVDLSMRVERRTYHLEQ